MDAVAVVRRSMRSSHIREGLRDLQCLLFIIKY